MSKNTLKVVEKIQELRIIDQILENIQNEL